MQCQELTLILDSKTLNLLLSKKHTLGIDSSTDIITFLNAPKIDHLEKQKLSHTLAFL